MTNFTTLFQNLGTMSGSISNNHNYYVAVPIPDFPKHKLAKDIFQHPCLLISTSKIIGPTRPSPIKLEHISILYNINCKIIHDKTTEEDRFTVISCTDDDASIQKYFLRISETIIPIIGKEPTLGEVSSALDKLVELFRALKTSPRKSVQGIWAELLLITLSSNPRLLLEAWHCSPLDKYDFSKNDERIEVKSTSTRKRLHHFSLEQLNPPSDIRVLVASVVVERIGSGKSVNELIDIIRNKISEDKDLIFYIERIVSLTLGIEWRLASEEKFDYLMAKRSLMFYSTKNIPTINPVIPIEIIDVHFIVDLTNIPDIKCQSSITYGDLFNSIPQ